MGRQPDPLSARHLPATLAAVLVLAFGFAHIEIHIEGPAGWATSLPTWRIEQHWLLDLLWGSRPMTGYHAWVFPFIAAMFHFPLVFFRYFSWRAEARLLGLLMVFWIAEDFLWFVFNPAFGIRRFDATHAPWHKHWFGSAPIDYWLFLPLAVALFAVSCRPPRAARSRPSASGDNDTARPGSAEQVIGIARSTAPIAGGLKSGRHDTVTFDNDPVGR